MYISRCYAALGGSLGRTDVENCDGFPTEIDGNPKLVIFCAVCCHLNDALQGWLAALVWILVLR